MRINSSIIFGSVTSLYAFYAYSKIGTFDNPVLQLVAFVGAIVLLVGVLIPFMSKENVQLPSDGLPSTRSWIMKAINDDLDFSPFLASMVVLFASLGAFYFFNISPRIGVPIAMLLFLITFFGGLWFVVKNKSKFYRNSNTSEQSETID